MGAQICTDDLPYKFLIPVFRFFMPVTCRSTCMNANSMSGYLHNFLARMRVRKQKKRKTAIVKKKGWKKENHLGKNKYQDGGAGAGGGHGATNACLTNRRKRILRQTREITGMAKLRGSLGLVGFSGTSSIILGGVIKKKKKTENITLVSIKICMGSAEIVFHYLLYPPSTTTTIITLP
ncbi:hypothetical protein L873DRAFT_604970 [Choiromyces venosus 120613-1]|uniref:Uncharacterized protein n=1 Tax=Choiromyces venosus 120613-1 TaxID=1336337 RepID=A0A3N4JXS7_9PEZI|nr:hypothetical protein L873DRAFT_604970 [Choiromyces venosus 120613-1]